jgi:cell volume regulation protein A
MLQAGDHVFVLLRPRTRWLVDRIFGASGTAREAIPAAEFPLRGETRVEEVEEFYGVTLDTPKTTTLDDLLRQRLGSAVSVGDQVTIGPITLVVRETVEGVVETVGMTIAAEGGAGG